MVSSDHGQNLVKLSKCAFYKRVPYLLCPESIWPSLKVSFCSFAEASGLQHSSFDIHFHERGCQCCLYSAQLKCEARVQFQFVSDVEHPT